MSLRYLSMKQLSEVTGVDRLTIKKRLAAVKPFRNEGKAIIYDAHEAIPVLLTATATKNEKTDKLMDEQLRYERARADKIILEVREREGQVVDVTEVAKVVGAEYANVRARLLGIPSRCAKDLSLESNPSLVKDRLDQEVAEALEELVADAAYREKHNVDQPEDSSSEDSTEES